MYHVSNVTYISNIEDKVKVVKEYLSDIAGLIGVRSSLFGPNLDPDGLLRHYIPMLGVANYNLLALTVLNPRLVRNLNARDQLT